MNSKQIRKALIHADSILQTSRQLVHVLQHASNVGEISDQNKESAGSLFSQINDSVFGLRAAFTPPAENENPGIRGEGGILKITGNADISVQPKTESTTVAQDDEAFGKAVADFVGAVTDKPTGAPNKFNVVSFQGRQWQLKQMNHSELLELAVKIDNTDSLTIDEFSKANSKKELIQKIELALA